MNLSYTIYKELYLIMIIFSRIKLLQPKQRFRVVPARPYPLSETPLHV